MYICIYVYMYICIKHQEPAPQIFNPYTTSIFKKLLRGCRFLLDKCRKEATKRNRPLTENVSFLRRVFNVSLFIWAGECRQQLNFHAFTFVSYMTGLHERANHSSGC